MVPPDNVEKMGRLVLLVNKMEAIITPTPMAIPRPLQTLTIRGMAILKSI
jgi:hypothetical protein